MNILISAHTYIGYGLGNIYRSIFLYDYLMNEQHEFVSFESNTEVAYSIAKNYSIVLDDTYNKQYDVVIYDSPYNFLYNLPLPIEEIERIRTLKLHTKCLIALDYCRFSEENCNIAINLCNHNINHISKFKGLIYQGVQYAILKPEIIQAKNIITNKINDILICIGGEDNNSFTLCIVKELKKITNNFSVVLGPWHKDFKEIQELCNPNQIYYNITNMGHVISSHGIIICNGGTTLLESMYLQKQIIPIAQSKFEEYFISCCSSSFYTLDDIPKLLIQSFSEINYSNIDIFGKKRIHSIILKHG